jgi:ATP-dependent helicase/nuclease subunit B
MLKGSLHKSLLVLPTSRSIREYIELNKRSNQLLNKTISIGDFFQKLVLPIEDKRYCDSNLKKIFLQQSIDKNQFEELGFSSEFSSFFKQSDYIFRFFTELSNEYVGFEELLNSDTYTLYSDHIEILQSIYHKYRQILDENGYIDPIFLPKSFKINKEYITQFDSITIKLEGYLSKFEQNIIEQVSKIKDTYITVTFNSYNGKNKEFLNSCNETLEEGFSYILDLTEKKLLQKQEFSKKTKSLQIGQVDSFLEQVAFIKYQITQMVQSGIEPEKIAVVVPDESVVESLELFDTEHYFNFAMGRSISNHKMIKALNLVHKLMIDDEPVDYEKLKFLKLELEQINKVFKTTWNKPFTKEIFSSIIEFIYTFEIENELLEKIENLKLSLEVLFFSNTIPFNITTKQFIKILLTELNSITLDDTHGGKITVLGILETRAVSFDGVIVCDFNDEKIPKRSVKDKFLSSKLKRLVDLPTVTDRENLQKYYYKRLFDSAKSLALCFVEDDISVISRFMMQLFSEYKQYLHTKNYESILYTKKELAPYKYDIQLSIDLSTKEWSATSLKTYLTCKRKYYFSYLANLKEHTISLKPESFEVGQIIHKTLENAVLNKALTQEYVDTFISSYQKKNPYLTLELELWKQRLQSIFKNEKNRSDLGIEIVAVEEPFKILYNGIKLKGTIDRVDKFTDGSLQILDYKTSSNLKIDTIKTYEKSNDFQLEFYYLAKKGDTINSVAYYDLYQNKIKEEVVLDEKLHLLDEHLKTLKTTKVEFSMTENLKDCNYCPYKILCQRD